MDRFAYLPLLKENDNFGFSEEGELIIDSKSGHIYVKRDDGFDEISKTEELEERIKKMNVHELIGKIDEVNKKIDNLNLGTFNLEDTVFKLERQQDEIMDRRGFIEQRLRSDIYQTNKILFKEASGIIDAYKDVIEDHNRRLTDSEINLERIFPVLNDTSSIDEFAKKLSEMEDRIKKSEIDIDLKLEHLGSGGGELKLPTCEKKNILVTCYGYFAWMSNDRYWYPGAGWGGGHFSDAYPRMPHDSYIDPNDGKRHPSLKPVRAVWISSVQDAGPNSSKWFVSDTGVLNRYQRQVKVTYQGMEYRMVKGYKTQKI